MILHVLTACSRIQTLTALGAALERAEIERIQLHWHVAFDLERRHVGGQAVKNRLLDQIPADDPGWVWICDDDNLPHPVFFRRLAQLWAEGQRVGMPDAYLFAQLRGPLEGGRILPARPPRAGYVDAAQLVARRSYIGDYRLPATYDGDGVWIEGLYVPGAVALIDEPITLYNGATWWQQ